MANLSNINGKFVVEQTTGYVGVGTTDPNFLIEAAGANSEIALNSTSASIYRLRSTSSDSFIITKNGVGDRLTIAGNGNATFAGSVDVTSGASYGSGLQVSRTSHPSLSIITGGTSNAYIGIAPSGGTYVDAITISDTGNATFAGNVTISQPTNGSDAILNLTSKSSAGNSRTSSIEYDADNEYMYFKNAGTTVATMTSGGNVGIGTDTPSALLEIQTAGTTGSQDFQIFSRGESPNYEVFKISRSAGSTELLANQNLTLSADYDANHTSVDSNIIFKTDNTERMRIDSSGFGYIYNRFYLATASNQGNLFFGTADNQYNIFGGGTYGYMGYNTGGFHRFLVNGSNRLQIEDNELKAYPSDIQVLRLTPDYIQIGRIPIRYPYYRTDSFKTDGSGYFWAFGHEKSDGTQSINMLLNDGASGNKYTTIINNLHIASFASNELGGSGQYPTFTTNVVLRNNGDSYFNGGDVGIGVTSPSGTLHILGTSDQQLKIDVASGGAFSSINFAEGGTNKATIAYRHTTNEIQLPYTGNNFAYVTMMAGGAERVRITSNGNSFFNYQNETIQSYGSGVYGGKVVIKASGAEGLCLLNNSIGGTSQVAINFTNEFVSNQYNFLARIIAEPEQSWTGTASTRNARLSFFTSQNGSAAQRMSILHTGEFVIGNNSTTAISTDPIHSLGNVNRPSLPSGAHARLVMQERTGNWISFVNGTPVHYGTISVSGSGVNYGSNSDYRLKENVQDLTNCIDKVKLLSPKTFNFTDRPNMTVNGFIAHEVQEVVYEAVTGKKDDVITTGNIINDSDGVVLEQNVIEPEKLEKGTSYIAIKTEPKYQQIDQSKLVPLLVGAIQELKADNDSLKARIETLENN